MCVCDGVINPCHLPTPPSGHNTASAWPQYYNITQHLFYCDRVLRLIQSGAGHKYNYSHQQGCYSYFETPETAIFFSSNSAKYLEKTQSD